MVKIEITPRKIIPEATTVWNEPGPEVDLVLDIKELTFREGTVDELYVFNVLDRMFLHEGEQAMKNWFKCLKPGGKLFVVVDNFEYLARGFVGGDFDVAKFNSDFSHASYYTRDSLTDAFFKVGFKEGNVVMWYEGIPEVFKTQHFELMLSAQK